eukprot:TRINITY_DN11823_c0_g1_i1.p1 TRINITY_DN11823_c0_g1~~TRINITY_DN11823_c0_g1_i1.p1  ORF type:complete len:323 (-),score=71.91 TRINITY_DN11823_c0_g1_i1:50-1018(-)
MDSKISNTNIYLCSSFSPDGKHMVAGNHAGWIFVWDVASIDDNKPVQPSYRWKAHEYSVYCIKFVNNKLISGGDPGLKMWDWPTILQAKENGEDTKLVFDEFITDQNTLYETNGIDIDYVNSQLYSACGNKLGYCWDIETGATIKTYEGHHEFLTCIKYNRNYNRVITGSEDSTAKIWDNRTNDLLFTLDCSKGIIGNEKINRKKSWISCMDCDASGNWLICGSGGTSVYTVWDICSPRVVSCFPVKQGPEDVKFINDKILTVGLDSITYTWNFSGEPLGRTVNDMALTSLSSYNEVYTVCGYSNEIILYSPYNIKMGSFTI